MKRRHQTKYGHVLSIVLIILSFLFSLLSMQAYRVKIRSLSYEGIQIAYDISMIEMKSVNYIQYCLSHEQALSSYQSDKLTIQFTKLETAVRCYIEWPMYEVVIGFEAFIEDQCIKKIVFL